MTDLHATRPHAVSTPAELIRQMNRLKNRSGLTYRQIAARAQDAGDWLPRSTLADALTRHSLPREELLAAFVRACTRDEQTVQSWILARGAVTAQVGQAPTPEAMRLPPSARHWTDTGHRWRRPLLVLVFTTACGTAAWQLMAWGNPASR